jgi:hypothetical protein
MFASMSFLKTLRHLFHPQRSNNHRPKILHPDALFSLVMVVAVGWLALYPAKYVSRQMGEVLGYASNITASEVVQKTNQERATQGLPALQTNDQLNQAALAKAQYMFTQQFWAHVAPDGTQPWKFFRDANYKYSVAGENLARDFSNTGEVMSAWMASPTHRKNILESRYQDIGVAVLDGDLMGNQTTLVVQMFGTPSTVVPSTSKTGSDTTKSKNQNITVGSIPVEITFAEQASPRPAQEPFTRQEVLASTVLQSSQLQSSIFFSPLQMSKAFFLAVIFLISTTLIYDSFIMNHYSTVRLVGKNFAHLALLMVTAFLLLLFKGGVIG